MEDIFLCGRDHHQGIVVGDCLTEMATNGLRREYIDVRDVRGDGVVREQEISFAKAPLKSFIEWVLRRFHQHADTKGLDGRRVEFAIEPEGAGTLEDGPFFLKRDAATSVENPVDCGPAHTGMPCDLRYSYPQWEHPRFEAIASKLILHAKRATA